MNNTIKNTLIALTSVGALAVSANAQTIDSNTAADWTLNSAATGSVTGVEVTSVPGGWASVAGANYVSFAANSTSPSENDLEYTISFTGTAGLFNLAGEFNVDDDIVRIELNGVTLGGITANSFDEVDTINTNVTTLAGANTLKFVVDNTPENPAANPSGVAANLTLTAVPEPSSTALLGLGALGLLARRKR